MKKLLFSVFFLGFGLMGFTQKYAIIDTRYILDKLPDYKIAQKQLDDITAGWQKDIDEKQAALDKMYKDYENPPAACPPPSNRNTPQPSTAEPTRIQIQFTCPRSPGGPRGGCRSGARPPRR